MSGYDWDVIERSLPYLFREGMTFSVTLTLLAMMGGIVFGTILAMMRLAPFRVVSMVAGAYVNLMRSIPLVLVIFWFFFLVPYIGAWVLRESNPIRVGAFYSALVMLYNAVELRIRQLFLVCRLFSPLRVKITYK